MADFTPLTSSSTRNAIGWVKLPVTPGRSAKAARIFETSSSLLRALVHSDWGCNVSITSVESIPIGSVAMSARPVLETASSTSGNFLKMRCARVCKSTACCNEMLGKERASMATAPSSSAGRNSVPIKGTNARAPNKARTAARPTRHGRRTQGLSATR